MEKILTIGIACYNVEKYISKTLDSITKSKLLDYIEIIAVNDESNDNTLFLLKEYEQKHPNSIKVVDKKNGGHGSCINESLKNATGKYFKIVDGDDWVSTEGLDKLINDLINENFDVVFNPFNYVYEKSNVIKKYEIDENLNNFNTIDLALDNNDFKCLYQMHCITYKTSILRKLNTSFTEHSFYVDSEYNVFPLLYANTYCIKNYDVYQYRLGRVGQSVNEESYVKNREQLKNIVKNLSGYVRKNNFSIQKQKFIYTYIATIISRIYKIYFYMPFSHVNYKELLDFIPLTKNIVKKANHYSIKIKIVNLLPLTYYFFNIYWKMKYKLGYRDL